jgi:hypothetical protein
MPHAMPSRKSLGAVILLLGLFAFRGSGGEASKFDTYGGLKDLSFGPGKFFRTHYDGQRWWLVTPEGGAFLSLGVCVVNPDGDVERGTNIRPYHENVLRKHGSVEQWIATTRGRLKEWGLNTLGGWSGTELRSTVPYTIELSVSSALWGNDGPDFFRPEALAHIRRCSSGLDKYVGDPYLIGYYLDNELPWSPDWRRMPDLFSKYVAFPPQAPGKLELLKFFKERYQTYERFSAVWSASSTDWDGLASVTQLRARDRAKAQTDREDFVLLVARQYFKTATDAIRAKDANHLILGCRFVWALAPKPAVQACGEYCDVVSLNYYEAGIVGKALLSFTERDSMRIPTGLNFAPFYDAAKKPLLVTEFGFRSMDSGLPNSYPPGLLLEPTVPTQKARADKFEQCATTWMPQPYFLGYHWFEYMDEPKGGRFDGEDGNFGLVNIEDNPYAELVERLKNTNARVWDLHRAARSSGGQ